MAAATWWLLIVLGSASAHATDGPASPPAVAGRTARAGVAPTAASPSRPGLSGWRRTSGGISDVWLNPAKGVVYKRVKPVISAWDIMPQRDPDKRQALRDNTIWVTEKLRSAPAFAQYSHLLKRVEPVGRFGILQEYAGGPSWAELSPAARKRAMDETSAIYEAAHKALPAVEIDLVFNKTSQSVENIRFDANGSPTAIIDTAGSWWARSWKKDDPISAQHPHDEHYRALVTRGPGGVRRARMLGTRVVRDGTNAIDAVTYDGKRVRTKSSP